MIIICESRMKLPSVIVKKCYFSIPVAAAYEMFYSVYKSLINEAFAN